MKEMEKQKWPRTPHLPWSPGFTADDIISSLNRIESLKHIIITEKMDGENTTFCREYYHARSLNATTHLLRDWCKSFWNSIRYMIPEGIRISGENVYAKHSIYYTELESYFYGFGAYDEAGMLLSWKDTSQIFHSMGIITVPILYEYQGDITKENLRNICINIEKELFKNPDKHEGYVVRNYNTFSLDDFQDNVIKYVRKGHVDEDSDHWMHKEIVKNILKK